MLLRTDLRHHAVFAGLVLLAVLATGCDGGGPPAPTSFEKQLVITNRLIAPVVISVDETAVLGLQTGASSSITIPASAQWLKWASAKPLDSQGRLIPDDLADVSMAVGSIDKAVEITNVIGDDTYVTARILNRTPSAVSIGIYDGVTVACVSRLPAGLNGSTGFTHTGYYRLRAFTEFRAYRDASRCEGAYTSWTSSEIRDFVPKSGLLTLELNVAP